MTTSLVITVLTFIGGIVGTPFGFIVFKNPLNFLENSEKIIIRTGTISYLPIREFKQINRRTKSQNHLIGTNGDVLTLIFTNRYFWNILITVSIAAMLFIFVTCIYRLIVIEDGEKFTQLFLDSTEQGTIVPTSTFLGTAAFLIYYGTVTLMYFQKRKFKKSFADFEVPLKQKS